jgi:hypothetical protein
MAEPAIRWPAAFAPANTAVHVVNRIDAPRSADQVWAKLIRAVDWPGYYANAHDVVIEGGARDLSANARFTWKTFGVRLKTQVVEFEPTTRIAWIAKGIGVTAYHAWLIVPTPQGCHILTEETQTGFLARAGSLLFPRRMATWHQRWLEALAE